MTTAGGGTRYTFLDSLIGRLMLVENDLGLCAIRFQAEVEERPPSPDWRYVNRLEGDTAAQLRAYFALALTTFDLPLAPRGTVFQQTVWERVAAIPYGETRSYLHIARETGQPLAVRAVGAANGRNPLPIVVPCHRVVGSNGTLTGYAGGLEIKRTLLALEQRHVPAAPLFTSHT